MVTIFENAQSPPWSRRFVSHLIYGDQDDYLTRLAFVEYLNSIDADFESFQTLMEASLFPIRIGEPIAERLWSLDRDIAFNYDHVQKRAHAIQREIRKNLAISDLYDDYNSNESVLLLSLGDQQLVVDAIKKLPDKQWERFDDRSTMNAVAKRIAKAISESVTIEVLETGYDVTVIQGSHTNRKHSRKINKESGKFYITRNAIDQFGLTIPIHAFAPDAKPLINIDYPKPADNISIVVTGAPSGTAVKMTKGDTSMQRSLSANDLRADIWTFTVEKTKPADA